MKKIFTKLMLLAVAAAALVSCENNLNEENPAVEFLQDVVLTAEKPAEVRTELIEGVPYWSKGDAVGVYLEDNTKHYKFDNTAEEASLTATFKGQTAVANTLFVYYPYTANGVAEKGAKVDIPVNQEPTATSFDGKADIMLAKPVQLDEEGKQISDLEFARLGAIVKVVLKDKTGNLAGQHVSALTMTAANNLVGRVYIDVVNQQLGELYYGQSKSVTATYTEATQYEVNGTNATYVIVYPQTLAAGSTLSFEASTEGYAISKSIELGQDIVLESGKVATLNVSLAADNLVKEETGLALPFEDDFSWVGNTSTTAFSSIIEKFPTRDDAAMYTAVSTVYPEANTALKFSSGNAVGSLTTAAIDLSQPFSVVVNAKYYGSDASSLVIAVGEETKKTIALTADYADYVVEFDAASAKETITISGTATSKRFYLNDLKVVAGHDYVLPPVLTVSATEISGVSHEGEAKTFTYSVANPVDGVSATVTDNVDWITTADNNGTVTVTVAANEAEEAREGVITVTYGDLTKTVTVKQAAKPAEGGNEGGVAEYVKVTTAQSDWSGTYLIVSGTKAATTVNGSWLQATAVSESNGVIASNATTDAIAVTIAKSGNNYTIQLSDGKYLKTTNSNSGLSAVATADTNSTWTFSIESGAAKIVWSGNSSRHLRLNGDSGFRTYTTTTGTIATLYKLTGGNGGSTPEEPETPATPVLSINPATLDFAAEGGSKTVACTIENEVSGVNVTATESVDWLTTSVSGKTVTITATENTATTTRTATVTIAYTGAESKTVTVNQAAAEVVEPEQPGGDATAEVFTLLGKDFGAAASYTTTVQNITSSTDGSIWPVLGFYKQSATAAAVQFGAKSSNYILTPACTNDIATIEITCTGSYTVALWDASTNKVITGMYSKPSATGTTGTGGSVKFTLPAGYKQVKIISTRTTNGSSITTSNAATYITKIVVTSK